MAGRTGGVPWRDELLTESCAPVRSDHDERARRRADLHAGLVTP